MKTQDAPPTPPTSGSKAKPVRRATPVEQALVDRFRAALAGESGGEQTEGLTDEAPVAALGTQDSADEEGASPLETRLPPAAAEDGLTDLDTLPPMTVGALAATSSTPALAAASTGSAQLPAYNAAAVAQLLEKHVRQLLVSESRSARGDTPQVMLNLTDAVLPGTQLTLTQTEGGWTLASSSTSTDSYRIIRELAPQLQARFGERGLGDLDLQVTLAEGADS